MKRLFKVFEVFYYTFLTVVLISFLIGMPIIPKDYIQGFLGVVFFTMGALGLYKNQILLTRSRPLNYGKKSIVGKIVNVIFCIIGFIVFAYEAVFWMWG